MQNKASLVVVGSGIKFKSHLTKEAETYICNSDMVLYLVNEPAMQEWIKKNNPNSESLDHFYGAHPLRLDCYQAMTHYIIEVLSKNKHVCVVLYGHPTLFSKPALDAVILAKQLGYYTKVLPGISAEDCLFADLLINVGSYGCQSYEATDFLIHQRQFDPRSHLILWQVGIIGALHYPRNHDNKRGAKLLVDYLVQKYNPNHVATVYEAAQYPHLEPLITETTLAQLPDSDFTPLSTLYIPPSSKSICNQAILKALKIESQLK